MLLFLSSREMALTTFLLHSDSSDDVCIEDCYISTGDDLVAVKSGWDEYGISYGRPSRNIFIYRLVGETQSSGIAIGSEMSGGVSEVHAQDLHFLNSGTGITIKTSPGRGGYVQNVYVSNVTLVNVKTAIRFIGHYAEHPDEYYDKNALPRVEKITIRNVRGVNVENAGLLEGIERNDFTNICLSNITLDTSSKTPWSCSSIQGYSEFVSPETCEPLEERIHPEHHSDCYYPVNKLKNSNDGREAALLLSW